MANQKLTRKNFQKDYPTLHQYVKDRSAMTKTERQETELLYKHWCEPLNEGGPPKILWHGKKVPKYAATFAILSCSSRKVDAAKRFCMKFNGSGCDLEKCLDGSGFRHKCFFCRQEFQASSHDCKTRQLFEGELQQFHQVFRVDPFDEMAKGLGPDDTNMEATLKRLANDPPSKRGHSETVAASTPGFAALATDSESGTELSEDRPVHQVVQDEAPVQSELAEHHDPDGWSDGDEVDEDAEIGWTKSTAEKEREPPGLVPTQRQLGFVCEMEADLEACKNLPVHGEKKENLKRKASAVLESPEQDLKSLRLSVDLVVVYPAFGEPPNKFATQLLHALDPQKRKLTVHGRALFLASKDGEQCGSFSPAWPDFDQLLDEDRSRFEGWLRDKSYFQLGTGPGAMLFVPVDRCKAMEWEELENCIGNEAISKKTREMFSSRASCFPVQKSFCADSSSEDEFDMQPSKTSCQAFDDVKLFCSFAKDKITAASCKPEIVRPEMRSQVNVRAAFLIGRLYGLNALRKHYLKRLRGDVILFLQSDRAKPGPQPVGMIQWGNHWESMTSGSSEQLFRFVEKGEMDDTEADQEVEAQVRLEEMKGWSYAWLDYGRSYKRHLETLEEMAQPEDWKERLPETNPGKAKEGLPYLESYLQFKFAFSLHQSHEAGKECGIHLTSDGKTLNFATGLLSRKHLKPIIGIYERPFSQDAWDLKTPPKFDSRFKFSRWDFAAQGTSKEVPPLDLLTDECMQPGAERNGLQLHELKSFNPYASISSQASLQHIASKTDRFESDNVANGFNQPKGWDLEDVHNRKDQIMKQLDKVCTWCRTDRSIPVMTVFGDFSYQWLLPLPNPSQDDSKLSESPTLVAVLQPQRKDENDDPCYVFVTVLSLDMALQQARLCGKLHQRWTVSRRQAEELQKVVDAVKGIKDIAPNEEVKKAVQRALSCMKNYKECIARFLPSLATVETPRDSRPRSGSTGAESTTCSEECEQGGGD